MGVRTMIRLLVVFTLLLFSCSHLTPRRGIAGNSQEALQFETSANTEPTDEKIKQMTNCLRGIEQIVTQKEREKLEKIVADAMAGKGDPFLAAEIKQSKDTEVICPKRFLPSDSSVWQIKYPTDAYCFLPSSTFVFTHPFEQQNGETELTEDEKQFKIDHCNHYLENLKAVY